MHFGCQWLLRPARMWVMSPCWLICTLHLWPVKVYHLVGLGPSLLHDQGFHSTGKTGRTYRQGRFEVGDVAILFQKYIGIMKPLRENTGNVIFSTWLRTMILMNSHTGWWRQRGHHRRASSTNIWTSSFQTAPPISLKFNLQLPYK